MNYHLVTMTGSIEFPIWLQAELDKRGWRPTELAKRAKISDAAVSRFLSGARTPDTESLAAMAKAMKIRPEKMFLVAIGEEAEGETDQWAEDYDHKLRKLSQPSRSLVGRVIDSALESEEAEQKPKPKAKPAKV